ncbi:type II toxin-antitoxin system RelE/ParE family toxin [Leucobacter insecticola]|uniref:Toxin n=1 Tax=Leucobacter insecticola TaxID=2714934 RepID=A0A6G8FFM5_9MICO|nr:type II toxin-antitoxin system RelE/ParE family toxin [Leucobacter insecticola]QIM15276.1 type II toxin-antitoxin system RelE/ParE family toxin [Leucobacter insecticola]
MSGYRLTPAAQRDLSSIWDYTFEIWNVQQAETYFLDIKEAIERVARDPDRGRSCDDIREGYRRYAVGSHLIFYVLQGDRIDVMRILHQRMDPTRHV